MTNLPISDLPLVDEAKATEALKELFEEIQRGMGVPFVPNLFRVAANAENVAHGTWQVMKNIYLESSLPKALTAMILYNIAETGGCKYCGSIHKLTCQTLGITEESLKALAGDLESLNPERVQAIIRFANKAANRPLELVERDYEIIREHGVTDDELTEIVAVAAMGKYADIMADALKITVDPPVAQALGAS
ncbi:MAG: hypothetical protein AAF125_05185 [Chloroflexota bacterium]